MNAVEKKMLQNIETLELYMFENCNTYGDRQDVRQDIDNLKNRLVAIVGNRVIKESKNDAT